MEKGSEKQAAPCQAGKRSAAIDESPPVTPAGEAFQSLLSL